MPKLLTKRKQKWVNSRKPAKVTGTPISPSAAIQQRYYKKLERLIKQMTTETQREIKKLFKQDFAEEHFGMDASISSQARILTNALMKKFNGLFAAVSDDIAESFARQSNQASASSVYTSLKELSGGLSLPVADIDKATKDILKATITENVGLIKSISQEYLTGVQGAVMRSITNQSGAPNLFKFLQKHEGITYRRARMITHDQTRKAMNNLSKARLEKSGIKQYEWLHSGGSNQPRELHIKYNGKIFSFDDPPIIDEKTGERGHPGVAINCFPGSTEVSLSNGCQNLWRYVYEGDMVNLVIEGSTLQCTPNHPILTNRGWLPADKIQEGDYLISCAIDSNGGIDGEIDQSISSFEDLFVSFASTQGTKTSAGIEFNFHGDIPQNDVDAVIPADDLSLGIVSPTDEQIEQLVLALSDGDVFNRLFGLDAEIVDAGFSGIIREGDTLISGKFIHPDFVSCASITQEYSILRNDFGNDLSADVIVNGQLQDAISTSISGTDNSSGRISTIQEPLRGQSISVIDQGSSQSAGAALVFLGDLFNGQSPFKKFLRVQKKFSSIFSGHVYTMESCSGWYNVTPAQIISKNCRCKMKPIISFDD